jgi:RimJ/RimL family protein N-acetyltransferase
LLLRRWQATDAPELAPILEANVAHLADWIPARVSKPAPVAQLVERLEDYSAAFDADREWRYALFTTDRPRLIGETSLFPRTASERVSFDTADQIEIGYWLRADATGEGYATEAARAALALALTLPGMSRVSIRCDERNAPSVALSRRLGFQLAATIDQTAASSDRAIRLQVWEYTTTYLARGNR